MQAKLLSNIGIDIPVEPLPFETMAKDCPIGGEDLLSVLISGINNGYIRRFGAVINHRKTGYTYNALLVWALPEDKIDEVGLLIAEHPSISHCYQRRPAPNWPYNLYVMMHAKSEGQAAEIVTQLRSQVDDIAPENEFRELRTLKELKKTSFNPAHN